MGLHHLVHHFSQNVQGLPAEERALLGALASRMQGLSDTELAHIYAAGEGDGSKKPPFPFPLPDGWETEPY